MTDASFHLPDLGDAGAAATIVMWHVSPGDHVVVGQPLVSVETSDAIVEIPAPRSGRIAVVAGKPGESLHTGDLLLEFAVSHEDHGAVVGKLPDGKPDP